MASQSPKQSKQSSRTRPTDAERSRRRFARRQWARRWLTLRYVAVTVLVLGLVGGGVYFVYFSEQLSVHEVDVVGAQTISAESVRAAAAVPLGGPLATADLDAIRDRVDDIREVRSVEVTRKWPDAVLITVQEREAVAVVRTGALLEGVDIEGTRFRTYARAPSGLPRIETAGDGAGEGAGAAGSAVDDDAIKEAVTVIASLPREVSVLVDHLELAGVDDISLALRDGREVRWGSADASADKAKVLVALLSQEGRVIDVSVPGAPTVSG